MMSPIRIIATIFILGIFALWLIKTGRIKKPGKPSIMAKISFAFILLGIIFGNYRFYSYLLIGIGMVFAIVDLIKSSGKPKRKQKKKL